MIILKKTYFCSQILEKMAKKEDENLIDVGKVYSQSEEFVEKNKKQIGIVIGLLILAVAGYFAYTSYISSQNLEAAENIWKAEYYFEIDSLDKAMYGDGQYFGFEYIADNYSSTKTGKLASYYMGVILKEKGEYEAALDYLKKADIDDDVLGAIALGNIGDIYVELEDYKEALKYFNKAIKHSDNSFTAPIYLNKAAVTYAFLENYKKAAEYYERIINDYPDSQQAREVKKEDARVKQLAG